MKRMLKYLSRNHKINNYFENVVDTIENICFNLKMMNKTVNTQQGKKYIGNLSCQSNMLLADSPAISIWVSMFIHNREVTI